MPKHFKYTGKFTTTIRKECNDCIDNRKTLCGKDFCWLPWCKYDTVSRSDIKKGTSEGATAPCSACDPIISSVKQK